MNKKLGVSTFYRTMRRVYLNQLINWDKTERRGLKKEEDFMDISRLKDLIIKYRNNRDYYCNTRNAYNETECRDEYINPLLECFGWDVQNAKGKAPQYKEVVVERFSNSAERPDYTLTLNGVSKIFVEAKKPSVDITIEIEPVMQTRR